jgi:hypothetical protein
LPSFSYEGYKSLLKQFTSPRPHKKITHDDITAYKHRNEYTRDITDGNNNVYNNDFNTDKNDYYNDRNSSSGIKIISNDISNVHESSKWFELNKDGIRQRRNCRSVTE